MNLDSTFCVSCLLLALAVTEGVLRDLTNFKDFTVNIHNFYRRYEKASNMKEMRWDPKLQREAELWSENCQWKHQQAGFGENLAYFWTTGPSMSTFDVIVKSCQNWWKEVYDWSWSTDCGAACHYTQMIWWNTERIGCALSKCSNLRMESGQSHQNADYFVCFYDPPGNFIGQHPYKRGDKCTSCSPGEGCNNGLCSKQGGIGAPPPTRYLTNPRPQQISSFRPQQVYRANVQPRQAYRAVVQPQQQYTQYVQTQPRYLNNVQPRQAYTARTRTHSEGAAGEAEGGGEASEAASESQTSEAQPIQVTRTQPVRTIRRRIIYRWVV